MKIKELRIEKNLTQYEIAKAINTSQRNISRWENGENEPSSSFVVKLANFFDVSADYLLGIEDDFGARVPAEHIRPIGDVAYSSEERKLIEIYRSLPEKLKKVAYDQLEILSGADDDELLNKQRKKV